MEALITLLFGLALYFVPSIIALHRNHHNQGAIFALNLVAGWTGIGWLVALVWGCTAVRPELGGGKQNDV